MAGLPQDRDTINRRGGSIAVVVRNALRDAREYHAYLGSLTDPQLVALGVPQEEVTALREAYVALDRLARIAVGQETQPAADNLLFNAGKLIGPN